MGHIHHHAEGNEAPQREAKKVREDDPPSSTFQILPAEVSKHLKACKASAPGTSQSQGGIDHGQTSLGYHHDKAVAAHNDFQQTFPGGKAQHLIQDRNVQAP